mmetsp:Transcript_84431/g.149414  ORF Transcript_84431/g.149414 Transcript_84431/m.149414 type:complete len:86 (+) Transcript_84431:3-260(+)
MVEGELESVRALWTRWGDAAELAERSGEGADVSAETVEASTLPAYRGAVTPAAVPMPQDFAWSLPRYPQSSSDMNDSANHGRRWA